MAIEQKKKKINKTTYLVTQMGGIDALKAQTKLINILGSGIFKVLGNGKDGLSPDKILETIAPIIDNFDDVKVSEFVESLFANGIFVEENGVPRVVDFDIEFGGKINEAWQVVFFILETNFSMGK